MNRFRPRVILALITTLVVVVIAIVRVNAHFGVIGQNGNNEQIDQIQKVVVRAEVPDHQVHDDPAEIERLRAKIVRRVKDSFGQLSHAFQVNASEVDRMSTAVAQYMLLHRYGTRKEYLEHYPLEPLPGDLTEDKGENAERAWAYRTEWARYDSLRVDTIKIRPFYIHGHKEYDRENVAAVSRELSDGSSLLSSGAGDWSVYAVSIDVTIPSFDRTAELDTRFDVFFSNDAPNGAWSAVACQYVGVPAGVFVYIPRP